MNALVFLLATTPYFAGAEPAPPPATKAPTAAPAAMAPAPLAPGYSAPGGCTSCGGCATCGDCGSCCDDCGKVGLCARLKARLRRSSCGCDSECDSGCGGRWHMGRFHETSGGCDTCDDGCGGGGGLLSRLKGRLHRGACDTCCNSGCDTCGSCSSCGMASPAPALAPMAPGGRAPEPVGAPREMKRMPSDTTTPARPSTAPAPTTTPAKPTAPAKPSTSFNLEPAPRADFSLDAASQNPSDLNRR